MSLFGDLFKKKTETITLHTDLHSHLIPGIDDGAKTMEESLHLIQQLHTMGFSKLITTPHIMQHRFANSSSIIKTGLEELRRAVSSNGLDIQIEAAAEYYLDDHLFELIAQGDILTFGKNYLLFEMSYVIAPPDLGSLIFEMTSAGYQPVLAHPERYLFMHNDLKKYENLKNAGVLFQLNSNSLGGYYSKPVQKSALSIMKEGWIDFLGSDTHHQRQINALEKVHQSKTYQRLFEKNTILNQTL